MFRPERQTFRNELQSLSVVTVKAQTSTSIHCPVTQRAAGDYTKKEETHNTVKTWEKALTQVREILQ